MGTDQKVKCEQNNTEVTIDLDGISLKTILIRLLNLN